MCGPALSFSLLVALVILQPMPYTVRVQDEGKKPVEATVIVQSDPGPGRKELFRGKTNNGAIALLAKDIPKGATKVLILVAPADSKTYGSVRYPVAVERLRKDEITITVPFGP